MDAVASRIEVRDGSLAALRDGSSACPHTFRRRLD